MTLPSFYSEDTPASANETWARLHSDPLFAVRLPTFLSYTAPTACCKASQKSPCLLSSPLRVQVHRSTSLSCPMLLLNQVCLNLQIRQQEIGARKQIAKNPVQMESIKAEVGFYAAAVHVHVHAAACPAVVHASAGQMLLHPFLCLKITLLPHGLVIGCHLLSDMPCRCGVADPPCAQDSLATHQRCLRGGSPYNTCERCTAGGAP